MDEYVTVCPNCESHISCHANFLKIWCEKCGAWINTKDHKLDVSEMLERINKPEIDNFMQAVENEIAHQRLRWSDDNKTDGDWSALITFLQGKAVKAKYDGDKEKYLHHIITMCAALAGWHRFVKEQPTGGYAGNFTPEMIEQLKVNDDDDILDDLERHRHGIK